MTAHQVRAIVHAQRVLDQRERERQVAVLYRRRDRGRRALRALFIVAVIVGAVAGVALVLR